MHETDRRGFLTTLATTVAAGATLAAAQKPTASEQAAAANAANAAKRASAPHLAPLAFTPLPLGAIRPSGWLERQLTIQAAGLSGHLDEFWPDVADSQWFGGKAEGWERAPYWLDGAIPLAWTLDDAAMKARITKYVEHIVTSQRADGWYAPYPEDAVAKRYDMWAILLANKVLVQYHEATGDPRVLTAVSKSLRAMAAGLDRTPLYNWGKYRWFEGLVSVCYVYDKTGESWLLELANRLRAQGTEISPSPFEVSLGAGQDDRDVIAPATVICRNDQRACRL